MRVMTKIVAAILGVGLLVSASAALACNGGCHPPAPPSPPHNPKPPATPCHNGCGGGGGHHGGGKGGGDVNVNVTVKNSASASASAFGGASAGAYYGGGYGNWSQSQGIPQSVGGLNVVTGAEGGGFETYQEQSTVTAMMILQASCIDDTGVPHPASQVFGERDVRNEYAGEIYRCIAGTHMQVLMVRCGPLGGMGGHEDVAYSESSSYRRTESASSYESGYDSENGGYSQGSGYSNASQGGYSSGGSYAGNAGGCASMDFNHISFDGGQTLSCQKGQALWFEHGALTCKVQIPQRQCNERSLLRRFGAGIKVLTVTRTETITKRREVARQASYGSTSFMTFDGGVGGFVQ